MIINLFHLYVITSKVVQHTMVKNVQNIYYTLSSDYHKLED